MHRLVGSLVTEMGQAFPELGRAQPLVEETLLREEVQPASAAAVAAAAARISRASHSKYFIVRRCGLTSTILRVWRVQVRRCAEGRLSVLYARILPLARAPCLCRP